MTTRQVTLELTTEQEETIKALFGYNGWDYKEIKGNAGILIIPLFSIKSVMITCFYIYLIIKLSRVLK